MAASRTSVLLLLLTACLPPPEAPSELSDLIRYLYREFDAEDRRVLEAGVTNLDSFFSSLDLEGSLDARSFIPDDFDDADVAGVPHPDVPPQDCTPVAVARASRFDVADFAWLQTQVDQRPVEPTAAEYERIVLEPTDPTCFAELGCTLLRTRNEVRRENLLMAVEMTLWKDLRVVDVLHDGESDGRKAMIGRSWTAQSYTEESGTDRIVQSYTADFWVDDGSGGSRRMQALFQQSEIAGLDEDGEQIVQGTLKVSIDDALEAGDDGLSELLGE
jgi:hypothetical protein